MKKHILLFFTVLFTAVIFTHSSMSAAASTVESDAAFGLWEQITMFLHMPAFLTAISIRKAAHFVQFAAFGVLLSNTVLAYCGNIKNEIFKILFFLLAVPVIDEFIQYFAEGRSAQVSDVLLDFSGCVTGLICVAVILKIIDRRRKKRSQNNYAE